MRQSCQGAGEGQSVGRDGGASDGGLDWTQLGTRRSAWRVSSRKPRCAFDHDSKEAELADLTERSADPTLWDDPAAAQTIMRRAEELRSEIESWRSIGERASGLAEMAEMAAADPAESASLLPDLERDLASLQADWNRMEQQLLLGEPF
ncbi:MAG: PCRF domain-containing protein, partial [Candidatus Limnocylindria bacterium]